MTALTLVGAEGALRVPAVRDWLPERRVYYDPSVSIRLDALDRLLREHGRVDVLFVGSSIVRTNVRPLLFDQLVEAQTGIPVVSFNTGMLGLWPAGAYLYLERVWLQSVQPRLVVQGIRYPELRARSYAIRDDQFFGGVIERGWLEAGWIDRAVSWTTARVRLLQYRGVLPAQLQLWLRGRPGELEQDGRTATNERGFTEQWPLLPETRAQGLLRDTEAYQDSCAQGACDMGLDALRRSHALVTRRGGKFVLVNVPEFAARWSGYSGAQRYRSYLDTLRQLARADGFLFIDLTDGDPTRFSDEQEFSDYYHMSPAGAERFTRELTAALGPIIAGSGVPGEPGDVSNSLAPAERCPALADVVEERAHLQLVPECVRLVAANGFAQPAPHLLEEQSHGEPGNATCPPQFGTIRASGPIATGQRR